MHRLQEEALSGHGSSAGHEALERPHPRIHSLATVLQHNRERAASGTAGQEGRGGGDVKEEERHMQDKSLTE